MVQRQIDEIRRDVLGALADNRVDVAGRLLDSIDARARQEPDYWRLRVRAALARASSDAIDGAIRRTLTEGPPDPRLQLEVGMLCVRLGKRRLARSAAEAASRNTNRQDAALLDAIGTLFVHCECVEQGAPLLRQAVALQGTNAGFLYNLAAGERMMGNFQAAEEALTRVLAIDPDHAEAHTLRAGLRSQTHASNHLTEIESALARAGDRRANRVRLLFALAKEAEDIGDYARSIDALQKGCALHRSSMMSYDVRGDVTAIDNIIRRFDEKALQPTPATGAVASSQAIFIVGLPRSGTTLLERMLDGHSAVTGMGELQAFPTAAIDGVRQIAGRSVDKMAFADLSLQVDPGWLGTRYLADADPNATRYFVDKLPMNYLYLGLIRRALPGAKLVVMDRDPIDSCFAMYKTLFADAYPFSYDLAELAEYYAAYARLIQHWDKLLGPALHHVRYEALVTEPERELGRLLEFLELGWEEGCLSFHRGKTAVTTASAAQVREPIHARSVGKWKRYGNALDVLVNGLRAAHICV